MFKIEKVFVQCVYFTKPSILFKHYASSKILLNIHVYISINLKSFKQIKYSSDNALSAYLI